MVGMRIRVRECELRPVRDAEEHDLVEAEGRAHGVEVLGVVGGSVQGGRGTDRRCARGREQILARRSGGDLERGAVEEAGVAGAAVVVGDERVAREEEAEDERVVRRAERERVAPSPGRGRRR